MIISAPKATYTGDKEYEGKGGLVTQSTQTKPTSLSNTYDPAPAMEGMSPLPIFSAGGFSMDDRPAELDAQKKLVNDAIMKFVKGKPLYGQKFRNKAIANIQRQNEELEKGFAEHDKASLRSRGYNPDQETGILDSMKATRSKSMGKALDATKLQMDLQNAVGKVRNRQWGIGQMLDLMAAEKNVQQRGALLNQEANQRLQELTLRSQLGAMEGQGRLSQLGMDLTNERNLYLQDLRQRQAEIKAQQKRNKGKLFGGLFGSALGIGLGFALPGAVAGNYLASSLVGSGVESGLTSGFGLLGGNS